MAEYHPTGISAAVRAHSHPRRWASERITHAPCHIFRNLRKRLASPPQAESSRADWAHYREAAKRRKLIAEEFGAPVIAASQLNRDDAGGSRTFMPILKRRNYGRPIGEALEIGSSGQNYVDPHPAERYRSLLQMPMTTAPLSSNDAHAKEMDRLRIDVAPISPL